MYANVAARIPELGRHPPEKVRQLFVKHQDRILFATDFMVYDRLSLGSSGDDERPTDDDGATFYAKCWRWFETDCGLRRRDLAWLSATAGSGR